MLAWSGQMPAPSVRPLLALLLHHGLEWYIGLAPRGAIRSRDNPGKLRGGVLNEVRNTEWINVFLLKHTSLSLRECTTAVVCPMLKRPGICARV